MSDNIILDEQTKQSLLAMVRELSTNPFDLNTLETAYRTTFGNLPDGGIAVEYDFEPGVDFINLRIPGVIGLLVDDAGWGVGLDDGYDYHFVNGVGED